jgi:hypothetical protein
MNGNQAKAGVSRRRWPNRGEGALGQSGPACREAAIRSLDVPNRSILFTTGRMSRLEPIERVAFGSPGRP